MNRPSILVVDDEAPLRDVLTDLFEIEGYEIAACPDAESAWKKMSEKAFDVALVDIFLTDEPVGLRLARRILVESPSTSVVLMTGYADELDIHEGFDLGVHACIRKPFVLDDVIRVVGTAVDNRSGL